MSHFRQPKYILLYIAVSLISPLIKGTAMKKREKKTSLTRASCGHLNLVGRLTMYENFTFARAVGF